MSEQNSNPHVVWQMQPQPCSGSRYIPLEDALKQALEFRPYQKVEAT